MGVELVLYRKPGTPVRVVRGVHRGRSGILVSDGVWFCQVKPDGEIPGRAELAWVTNPHGNLVCGRTEIEEES